MKKNKSRITLFTIVFLSFISSIVYPCTTFVLHQGNKIVFGRNLDWITGSGLIMTNPRNVKKIALVDPTEKAIGWISKYSSITFNQIGRDLPYGGINETGLVVEHMTLEQTKYPTKDNRYAISANQWIQFQLDNYSTIAEVINSNTLLRIVDATSKYHFLVCDKLGNVATIEFLDGKMVSHIQNSLPIPVLANSTYDSSLECYKTNENTDSNRSLYNFSTAAHNIQESKKSSNDSIVNDAFEILKSVSQGLGTKWSIVYDITNMRIYFKIFETPTIVGEQKIFMKQPGQAEMKFVDFKNFDFNCSKDVKVLNLNESISGAVDNHFINYSTEINKKCISEAFTFFKNWGFNLNIGAEQIDYLAKYPESFICIEKE
jgi:choloylglycine hydrolase